jgi:hypothetical protein
MRSAGFSKKRSITAATSHYIYIFNRDFGGEVPYAQMLVEGLNGPRQIPCSEIVAISFTGADAASGNDWEAWARKKESDRQAESARLEAAARARGHL